MVSARTKFIYKPYLIASTVYLTSRTADKLCRNAFLAAGRFECPVPVVPIASLGTHVVTDNEVGQKAYMLHLLAILECTRHKRTQVPNAN